MFIQKKKIQKKISQDEPQPKSMMGNFMKNVQIAVKGKKQVALSEDESFSCLTELTQMMANLLVPS